MKNINCALLAACLLAGMLISCGSDTGTPAVTDAVGGEGTTEAVTEAAVKPYIDAEDNGGKEIFLQGFQVYYAPACMRRKKTAISTTMFFISVLQKPKNI